MTGAGNRDQWDTGIRYSEDNILQTYDVYQRATTNNRQQFWVIYVHGGYFRDPLVSADCFQATVKELESSSSALLASIVGYATLNYRLSKHPEHPQSPDTQPFDLRNALWPDHLDDVLAGLRHLQENHRFGSNYLLVGHSVGAQLALLAALKAKEHGFLAPKVVLGMSGIYDFPLIHESFPYYKNMTFGAMKEGDEIDASPARHAAQEYEGAGVEKIVLGLSKDDGLVPWNQVEVMRERLARSKDGQGYAQIVELFGEHDTIWRDGKESSRAILMALDALATLS